MDPGSSRFPAIAGNQIIVADPAWRRLIRHAEALAARAAHAAGGDRATVVLASDSAVKRLNARHRGRNTPTNVLTFEPLAAGLPGEIFLALGTVRREAAAARRPPAHHLAHLVVHGALHLQGHDHHHPGEARRMEMAEARALRGLGLPNPWKRA
jgi:probable rRNA maturation factor